METTFVYNTHFSFKVVLKFRNEHDSDTYSFFLQMINKTKLSDISV